MLTTHKFSLGQVVATPGAIDALNRNPDSCVPGLLKRHLLLDPGELSPEDVETNRRAVTTGERVFSSYRLGDGSKVWVITEADRSSTCILLPEEY